MTTASIEPEIVDPPEIDDLQPYRAISKAAVVSLLLVFASLLALIFPTLLVLPAIGLMLGLLARRNLRRYPREVTGRIPALLGTLGCGLLLVGGAGYHIAIYLTEVPDGYQRISFDELQFEQPNRPTAVPDLPTQLDGKQVFVKGYVHPGVSDMGQIRRFVLVPDMGTCCFGGQPKLSDMIEVRIVGSSSVRYGTRKRRLAGTFHVRDQVRQVAGGLNGGYYELEADYVK